MMSRKNDKLNNYTHPDEAHLMHNLRKGGLSEKEVKERIKLMKEFQKTLKNENKKNKIK